MNVCECVVGYMDTCIYFYTCLCIYLHMCVCVFMGAGKSKSVNSEFLHSTYVCLNTQVKGCVCLSMLW